MCTRHTAVGNEGTRKHVAPLTRRAAASRRLLNRSQINANLDSVAEQRGTPTRIELSPRQFVNAAGTRWSDQPAGARAQETLAWVDANLDTLNTMPWSYQHKT